MPNSLFQPLFSFRLICILFLLPAFNLSAEENAPLKTQLTYTDTLILGFVEGISEYLPISSTGHLLLTNQLLGLHTDTPLTTQTGVPILTRDGSPVTLKAAADAYAIVIQAGAIAAVALLYWPRLWGMLMGIFGRDPNGLRLARNLIVAFLPAVFLGLLLESWIESKLFGPGPIAFALVAGGILMLGVEHLRKKGTLPSCDTDPAELSIRQCLTIGFLQCIAMWPGTSRSMMTIVGGYIAGLNPKRAAEFSFLLGLLTLTAAAGYKAVSTGSALVQGLDLGAIFFGCFIAAIAAGLSVRWLVTYLTRHGLALFAWYRFALAALVFVFLM